MKRILTFLLFLFFIINGFAQNKITNNIDSLERLVKENVGEKKVLYLIDLIWEYRNINPLISIQLADSALFLLEKYPNEKLAGSIYNTLGVVHTITGNYDLALSNHFKSLQIREKMGDERSIGASLNNIALVYRESGDYAKSLDFFQRSLEIKEKLGEKIAIATTLNNIGGIFRLTKNYNKALEYHQKAFIYIREIKNEHVVSLYYESMGDVYSELGNHSLAIDYYKNSLSLLESWGNIQGMALLQMNLGKEYFSLKEYDIATEYLLKSVSNSVAIDAKPQLSKSYLLLSEIFKLKKDYKTSLEYHYLYSSIYNQIFNSQQNKHLVEIQTRYENEKQNNRIKSLELEQQKSFRNLLILGIFVFLLIVIVVYQRYLYGLKENKQLIEKNVRIETLYKISNALNKSNDLKEFFKLIHETIEELMLAKNFYIAIYDGEKHTIRFPYFVDEADTDSVLTEFEATAAGKGLTEYLIKQGKLLLLDKKSITDLNKIGEIEIIGSLPIEWLGVPLIDEGGKTIGALVVQNYSEKKTYGKKDKELLAFVSSQIALAIGIKRSQTKIYESEQRFRMLAENVPGIIYLSKNEKNYSIVYLNDQIKNITGYDKELFLNEKLSFADLYHPDDTSDIFEKVNIAVNKGDSYHFIYRLKHKEGYYIWLEEFGSSIVVGENQDLLFEGFILDITQRKIDEEKIILAKEQAEKSDKLKSEFLAQMSHEIRTPINTILSFSSLLRDELEDKVDDDLKTSFSAMASAGRRIIRTIDLILNMSEVQAGIYDYVSKYLNVGTDLLDPIRNELAYVALEKGLILKVNLETDDLFVWADEYTVGQIVNNLVDNAIKYTNEGTIDVNIYRNLNNRLVLEVKDTGIGISKEYLPSLFTTFSQEEQGYTRKFEGNGLGLALVKKYCELNNAYLEVESEKGVGTTFRVIFS